ncbi:MAG TPA: sigma-70 family RNA polymerase sigma factor [Gemmatales bacterium]|nr:sigma-70 family RNA polymerase sigma factor [Gemmatales bacterium]HMP57878.1 sigma-70 family RNA polymerase sigma factor [Gemmatales bacterium]
MAESFPGLMDRACRDEPQAQALLVERYSPIILRVVRRHLSPELRRLFDSVDLQQDVWHSFFRQLSLSAGLDTPEALARYLNTIAKNHLVDLFRKWLGTSRRALAGECSNLDENDMQARLRDTPATASQQAIAAETRARIGTQFPPHYLRIVELREAGETYEAIAEALQLNERTVRRVLERVQTFLVGS